VTAPARALVGVLAWTVTLAWMAVARAYEVASVTEGGRLTGVVKFKGRPPRLEPLSVRRDHAVCGEGKPSEALVLGPGLGVKGSVILLKGVARGKKGSRADVVVDTHGCVFGTHVLAAMAGDRVRVKNSDSVLHNTYGTLGTPIAFNVALPAKDQTIDITRRLTRPGVVHVLCGAHPHMFAWIVLHDSPYFAVTDERGTFSIDDIPPGTYKVTMWHEGFRSRGVDQDGRLRYEEPRTVRKRVTIGPRATASVEFELR